MYEIYRHIFINPKQITRAWLDTKRDIGMSGDYSGSHDKIYYMVKIELSSGKIFEIEFESQGKALETLRTVVGTVG